MSLYMSSIITSDAGEMKYKLKRHVQEKEADFQRAGRKRGHSLSTYLLVSIEPFALVSMTAKKTQTGH